eukprot:CAMPEP_0181106670 /NCGR_PEP_ID=MMETSP1071-20121207/16652_1 /TAXON_ID=35127 /ORGANISM="Thalassiosira sp., Strain NH16" /LENGTH=35 /DNA_ID= /DNA_START= /DNA_END= /DNA_ORIENTATION=
MNRKNGVLTLGRKLSLGNIWPHHYDGCANEKYLTW